MRELTPAPPDRSTRFYLGRRTADDARQISRWSGVTGEKGRWKVSGPAPRTSPTWTPRATF